MSFTYSAVVAVFLNYRHRKKQSKKHAVASVLRIMYPCVTCHPALFLKQEMKPCFDLIAKYVLPFLLYFVFTQHTFVQLNNGLVSIAKVGVTQTNLLSLPDSPPKEFIQYHYLSLAKPTSQMTPPRQGLLMQIKSYFSIFIILNLPSIFVIHWIYQIHQRHNRGLWFKICFPTMLYAGLSVTPIFLQAMA